MNITTGTVISGTHRPIDLIPAFLWTLEDLNEDRADLIRSRFPEVEDAILRGLLSTMQHDLREDMDWMLDALYDALDEEAPEGYYFGAAPGDGADFGFWRYE